MPSSLAEALILIRVVLYKYKQIKSLKISLLLLKCKLFESTSVMGFLHNVVSGLKNPKSVFPHIDISYNYTVIPLNLVLTLNFWIYNSWSGDNYNDLAI